MPTDRGLELVADVGHEVAADLLDPAGLGVVLDEEQDVVAAQRGHAGLHDRPALAERTAGQLELGLADHTVATDLSGEVAQLARGRARSPRTRP